MLIVSSFFGIKVGVRLTLFRPKVVPLVSQMSFLLESEVAQSCPTLCDPMVCDPMALQTPLSLGFSRQEYWSGWPFPSPGGLSDAGIEPTSPALAGRFFTTKPPVKRLVAP